MNELKSPSWERFNKYYFEFQTIGLAVDLSRIGISDGFLLQMESRMQEAFAAMAQLEAGGIANPDENRMVGHYWLRNPAIAPTSEIRKEIEENLQKIKALATDVHSGRVRGAAGEFKNLLLIGIGGSTLGPQFVSNALGHPRRDKLKVHFFDNTDPDGMERVLSAIGTELGRTLCLVVSKSGRTKETRNGMIVAKVTYESTGLDFSKHAIAITGRGSELDLYASSNSWIRRFPMWDWVGGRTSELSSVGLLPAALQGIDIDGILAGARACDEVTRVGITRRNPSALLALAWFAVGNGVGEKNMVVLPYKDRLELFSRYLQQLVMESIGKERNIAGTVVNQGLTVFGNKGSTDQHSYIQQLRDGLNDFVVTFIEVLRHGDCPSIPVENDFTAGDFLHAFFLGTREALSENGRESITITTTDTSPFSIGVLLALFDRVVGYYASLLHLNAYHQPGVESGKQAAANVIELKSRILTCLEINSELSLRASDIAVLLNEDDCVEHVFKVCEQLAANRVRGIVRTLGSAPSECRYSIK